MAYNIRMGIPEMAELWSRLQTSYRDGTINKKDAELYKKWGAALKKLAQDPHYPGLNTHDIEPLSKRYGLRKGVGILFGKQEKRSQKDVLGIWTR